MKEIPIRSLALAGLFLCALAPASAVTYTENFASDPARDGWQIFGTTNLFQWNITNQNLQVTWDSTQSNTYFFHPLEFAVTANDDFSVAFDINLSDIVSDTEPGKTGPMQLGFEFLDLAAATDPSFVRNNYGTVPNIAGLDYYAYGYFTFGDTVYPSDPATTPTFVSGTDPYDYAPQTISVYDNTLPDNQVVHMSFSYTASNQTAVVSVTTNGVPLVQLPPLALNGGNGFTDPTYDFSVDTFCLCNFTSIGDPYNSILAHGTIANLVVTVPPPAQNLSTAFSNGVCQVQFTDHLDWMYTLQRTTNIVAWTDVSASVSGNGTNLILSDSDAPPLGAFYRVSATR